MALFFSKQAIIIWRAGSAGYLGNLRVDKCLLPHFCWFFDESFIQSTSVGFSSIVRFHYSLTKSTVIFLSLLILLPVMEEEGEGEDGSDSTLEFDH